jgi:hypothetical protein
MTSPSDVERKVRQLDNDVQSIYELLSTIQATQRRHGNRLDEIAAAQAGQDTKLDTILRLLQPGDS